MVKLLASCYELEISWEKIFTAMLRPVKSMKILGYMVSPFNGGWGHCCIQKSHLHVCIIYTYWGREERFPFLRKIQKLFCLDVYACMVGGV